jgi:large repetitive protein
VENFSFRVGSRFVVGTVALLACAGACAEGTEGELDGATLTDGGKAPQAGAPASGSPSGGAGSGTGGAGTAGMSTGGKPAGGSGGQMTSGGAGSGGMSGAGGTMAGAGGTAGAGGSAGAGGKGGGGSGGGGNGGGGNGGSAGAGGATGYRYVRFEATSELAGEVWSSVAELQVFTTGDVALSRSGWEITADSEETDDQNAPASAAIDGDTATFWHTEWEPAPDDVNDAALPHHLDIDLGSAQVITGFSYLPRQSNANGRVKDWKFYVSSNGTAWGTAIDSGTFPSGTALQKVSF